MPFGINGILHLPLFSFQCPLHLSFVYMRGGREGVIQMSFALSVEVVVCVPNRIGNGAPLDRHTPN